MAIISISMFLWSDFLRPQSISSTFRYNIVCLRVLCSYCCKFLEFQSFPHCKRSFLPCTHTALFFQQILFACLTTFFAITNGKCDDFYFELPNRDKNGKVCWICFCCCRCCRCCRMSIYLTTCLSGIRKASFYNASLQLDLLRQKTNAHTQT